MNHTAYHRYAWNNALALLLQDRQTPIDLARQCGLTAVVAYLEQTRAQVGWQKGAGTTRAASVARVHDPQACRPPQGLAGVEEGGAGLVENGSSDVPSTTPAGPPPCRRLPRGHRRGEKARWGGRRHQRRSGRRDGVDGGVSRRASRGRAVPR